MLWPGAWQVVHFELWRGDEPRGVLHLVDLAGSERLSRTEAIGERRAEGVAVNKSLSALGDVMQALVGKAEHVPYRNSRLTQLLQPGLSKGCRVALVLAASPADADAAETAVALSFGVRARAAQLGPACAGGAGAPTSARELARAQKMLTEARAAGATQQREAEAARRQAAELNERLKASADALRRADARARGRGRG